MNAIEGVKKLADAVSGSLSGLGSLGKPVLKVLTFSLGDDALAPAKSIGIAVEWGLLSVAYGSRIFSRLTLRECKLYPAEDRYPTPEVVASTAELMLSTPGASNAEVTFCIPKAWTVIKIAELPATVRDNLHDVISYEIDRFTPFASEEAFYDFRVIKEDSEKLTVLVVAARTDLIGPYIEALREKGGNVTRLTVNLSAIGTLCLYAGKHSDALFVRIGEKEYEGAVFEGGSVAGAFAGSFRSDDDREKSDAIMTELGPLLERAGTDGKSPQVIVSARDGSASLREMLKLRMSVPFSVLEETDIPLGRPVKQISYEAAGGVIESLWPRARGLNLLNKGHVTTEKFPLTPTIILAAGILAMWLLSFVSPIRVEGTRLEEMDRQIAMRKDEARKIEALKQFLQQFEGPSANKKAK